MRRIQVYTTTYEVENGFRIDIVDDVKAQCFYAWLWHKDICIKEMMFGLPYEQPIDGEVMTHDEFFDIVEANLETQNYIGGYIEDYMNE